MATPQHVPINPSTLSAGMPTSQMSFVAAEMQVLNDVGSMLSSQGAASSGGMGAVLVDVVQLSKDILGAISNLTPQSGGGGSPTMPTDPPSGSPNLLNLGQSSSTMNGALIPPGS